MSKERLKYILFIISRLVLCALFIYALITAYRKRGAGELFVLVFSLAVHEGFHMMSAAFLGYEMSLPRVALFGFKFTYTKTPPIGFKGALLYLSGPLGNIILALTISLLSEKLYIYKSEFFVFYNLLIAGVNLIPAYPLDAARAVCSVISKYKGSLKAVNITAFISELTALVMFTVGLYIFVFSSDNMLLMLLAIIILNAQRREKNAAVAEVLLKKTAQISQKS